jgi:hypothetical protein
MGSGSADPVYAVPAAPGDNTAPVLERWGDRAPLGRRVRKLDAAVTSTTPNPWIPGAFSHAATNGCGFRSGHFDDLAYMAGRTDEHRASRYITRRSTTHTR